MVLVPPVILSSLPSSRVFISVYYSNQRRNLVSGAVLLCNSAQEVITSSPYQYTNITSCVPRERHIFSFQTLTSSSCHSQSQRWNGNSKRTFSSKSSASKRDYYQVLGVSKSADASEIKKAYFALAKKYHPDVNKDNPESATEKFKEATEAYEVLSDKEKRQLYDQFGHAGVDPNAQFHNSDFGGGFADFGGTGFHFHQSGNINIDAEELFEAFFGGGGGGFRTGGGRRSRGPRRGADIQMQIQISLREAYAGCNKDLHLKYQERNEKTGRTEVKERSVEVDIPPGIDTGMNLRLAGKGAEGDPGAPKGNLLIQVIVEESDGYFHRDGADLYVETPISITQAILGGTVDVKTMEGMVEMKIPKGCQHGTKLMLRGKGMPRINNKNSRGNQIVQIKIEIPKKITARQEELLREFDDEMQSSGLGISGRIAKCAESAYEKIFGTKKHEKKGTNTTSATTDSNNNAKNESKFQQEEEEYPKQQQA
jgi:molecular chaperone DnaJ